MLDAIQSLAAGKGTGMAPGLESLAGRGFDWNLIMRLANERYDEYVEALALDSHDSRQARFEELDARVAGPAGMSTAQVVAMAILGSRKQVSQQLADMLFALMLPAVAQSGIAETRAETQLRLTRLALMLGACRADQGAYPEALEELSPDYLTDIPLDPFLDEPFRYERTESGYRLYSVGDNMTDDGGLTYDSEPRGDDIISETHPVIDLSEQSGDDP